MEAFDHCRFTTLLESIGGEAVRLWGEHSAVDVTYRIRLVDGKISGETTIRVTRIGVRYWEHAYTDATADLTPFEQIHRLLAETKKGSEPQD